MAVNQAVHMWPTLQRESLEGKTHQSWTCPTWMPLRLRSSSSTLTSTPPVHDTVIGIPEKCNLVQSFAWRSPTLPPHNSTWITLLSSKVKRVSLLLIYTVSKLTTRLYFKWQPWRRIWGKPETILQGLHREVLRVTCWKLDCLSSTCSSIAED